ncbi:MAG: hypothetical protein ACWGSQ_04150 [Longimicrobiales bacterium]
MRRLALLVSILMLGVACDSGPSGPGELTGILETPGPDLGGAVLEVVGKGVTGFSGSGGTHVFSAATGVENTYRVVLLAQTPGTLQFRVSVEDTGAKKPSVSVVSVVTGTNLSVPPTADYRVRFTRK